MAGSTCNQWGSHVDIFTPVDRVLVDRPRPAAGTSEFSASSVGRLAGATCNQGSAGVELFTPAVRVLVDRPRPAAGTSEVLASTVYRLDGTTCKPTGRESVSTNGVQTTAVGRHGDFESPESDSVAGFRRAPGYKPGRATAATSEIGSDIWFETLMNKLRPMIVSIVAEPTGRQHSASYAPTYTHTPSQVTATAGLTGPSLRPTSSFSIPFADEEPMEVSDQGSLVTEIEEPSPLGIELPQSLLDRVAGIFISRIGYDDVREAPGDCPGSRLNLTNKATDTGGPSRMPVDEQCLQRIEMLAARKNWSSYPVAQERLFNFPKDKWEALFRTPTISEETRNKVRAEQGLASGTFKDPLRKRIEDDWAQVDLVGRAGLKFSSVFMLCAEALLRAHQQLPEDDNRFTKQEVGALLYLQGPLSRLIFDQFARVNLKATQVRRGNLLDTFAWPSAEARSRLENLPVFGSDLFANKFVEKLSEEVERFRETAKASFAAVPKPVPVTQLGLPGRKPRQRTAGGKTRPAGGRGNRRAQVTGVRGRARGQGRRTAPYPPQQRRSQTSCARRPSAAPSTALWVPPHRIDGGGGGRLQRFRQAWESLCTDRWVVGVISTGYRLEFTSPPPSSEGGRVTPIPQDPAQREALEKELRDLLCKGAVTRTTGLEGPLFLSSFFLAPKRNNSWRPILNLKPLNTDYIRPQRFRMETLAVIIPTLRRGMWAASIDLKDAYLHIPIAPAFQRFLAFSYKGVLYKFTALPFGLSTSPRVFTRVAGAVVAELRRRGVTLFVYIDDWLILGNTESQCQNNVSETISLLHSLGWLINWEKSHPTPTQSLVYLGAMIDLTVGRVFPTAERLESLNDSIRAVESAASSPAKAWLRVLGLLASLVDVVPLCRLRMRPLQFHNLSFFRPAQRDLQVPVPLRRTSGPGSSSTGSTSYCIEVCPDSVTGVRTLPPSAGSRRLSTFRHL